MEFFVLTLISIAVMILVLYYVFKKRNENPIKQNKSIIIISFLGFVSMVLAKYGANFGFSWWLYYTLPVFLTILVPVIYFKMNKFEIIKYVFLIVISSPVIHVIFSLFGWKNYMPFIKVPSLFEIV